MRPFLKWAGGKRKLTPLIAAQFPEEPIRGYFEPFLGGGAVFLHLAEEGRFAEDAEVVLSDTNAELVNVWCMVRDNVHDVLDSLYGLQREYQRGTGEETFKKVRAQRPADLFPVDRAARVIFLNKTCFNGLWRENQHGEFNTPWGHRGAEAVSIMDERNLIMVRDHLRQTNARIVRRDFAEIEEETRPAPLVRGAPDCVYFDPPYLPMPDKPSFHSYSAGGFRLGEHQRLSLLFRRLSDRRMRCVMSNSDTPISRDLATGFKLIEVEVRRPINSDGAGRGKVGELIIVGERTAKRRK